MKSAEEIAKEVLAIRDDLLSRCMYDSNLMPSGDQITLAKAVIEQAEVLREAASVIQSHSLRAPLNDDESELCCLGDAEECQEFLTKYASLIE